MPLKYREDVKMVARRLFVEDGRTPEEIADTIQVSMSTVHKWIKKYHWDTAREELSGSARTVFEMLLKALRRMVEHLNSLPPEEVSTSLLDGLHKLMKSTMEARDSVPLLESVVMAGEEFVAFIRREVPDEKTRTIVYEQWDKFLEWAKAA